MPRLLLSVRLADEVAGAAAPLPPSPMRLAVGDGWSKPPSLGEVPRRVMRVTDAVAVERGAGGGGGVRRGAARAAADEADGRGRVVETAFAERDALKGDAVDGRVGAGAGGGAGNRRGDPDGGHRGVTGALVG